MNAAGFCLFVLKIEKRKYCLCTRNYGAVARFWSRVLPACHLMMTTRLSDYSLLTGVGKETGRRGEARGRDWDGAGKDGRKEGERN